MLPWNDLEAVRARDRRSTASDVAAVLMEPMMINAGAIEPRPGYLEGVRELCDRHGRVLVFDEIITGFRIALGGAAERYGVTPDLATYGKAMAGSWPVAALAGTAELMERFGTGEVTHAGTFNANVMGMAASDGDAAHPRDGAAVRAPRGGRRRAHRRASGSSAPATRSRSTSRACPMAFHVVVRRRGRDRLPDAPGASTRRAIGRSSERLVDHGVWVARRGIWYVSAAHGQREVEVALERRTPPSRPDGLTAVAAAADGQTVS